MGQFIFFGLFIMVVIVGAAAYVVPVQQRTIAPKFMTNNKGYNIIGETNNVEESTTKKNQEVNVTTNGGVLQIYRRIDDLAKEQKDLVDSIEDEQRVLKNTAAKIATIKNEVSQKDAKDLLRLKALGLAMEDEQRLLVSHGQALIALNAQLNKNRQWLAQQRDLVNINDESSFKALRQHDTLVHEQAAILIDKVKQQNSDSLQRTRDFIDEQRQKNQDQQDIMRQRAADQMQRIKDQRNR